MVRTTLPLQSVPGTGASAPYMAHFGYSITTWEYIEGAGMAHALKRGAIVFEGVRPALPTKNPTTGIIRLIKEAKASKRLFVTVPAAVRKCFAFHETDPEFFAPGWDEGSGTLLLFPCRHGPSGDGLRATYSGRKSTDLFFTMATAIHAATMEPPEENPGSLTFTSFSLMRDPIYPAWRIEELRIPMPEYFPGDVTECKLFYDPLGNLFLRPAKKT